MKCYVVMQEDLVHHDLASWQNEAVRVLIVDDETYFLAALRRHLARGGHEIVTCSGVADALRELEVGKIDVALFDVVMPGTTNGLDLLAISRTTQPDLPVVIMSASDRYGSLDIAKIATELGAAAVLLKPFEMNDLDRVLERSAGASSGLSDS